MFERLFLLYGSLSHDRQLAIWLVFIVVVLLIVWMVHAASNHHATNHDDRYIDHFLDLKAYPFIITACLGVAAFCWFVQFETMV